MLELAEEHFYQVKPGLSDYANAPEKVSNKKINFSWKTESEIIAHFVMTLFSRRIGLVLRLSL